MNNSSKVPPRFVPTLTEVVPADAETADGAAQMAEPARDQLADDEEHPSGFAAEPPARMGQVVAPLASFHSPWQADGLYGRSKPATIPRNLPPLPDSLPPQQPFAPSADDVEEPVQDWQGAELADTELAPGPALEESEARAFEEKDSAIEPLPLPLSLEVVKVSDEVYVEPDSVEPETLTWNEQAPQVTEEYLVHRLMQRVDLILEQRLKEAIAQVVQEQTRSLLPRLREEVESVVRQSVYEAVESELAQQTKVKPEG